MRKRELVRLKIDEERKVATGAEGAQYRFCWGQFVLIKRFTSQLFTGCCQGESRSVSRERRRKTGNAPTMLSVEMCEKEGRRKRSTFGLSAYLKTR